MSAFTKIWYPEVGPPGKRGGFTGLYNTNALSLFTFVSSGFGGGSTMSSSSSQKCGSIGNLSENSISDVDELSNPERRQGEFQILFE